MAHRFLPFYIIENLISLLSQTSLHINEHSQYVHVMTVYCSANVRRLWQDAAGAGDEIPAISVDLDDPRTAILSANKSQAVGTSRTSTQFCMEHVAAITIHTLLVAVLVPLIKSHHFDYLQVSIEESGRPLSEYMALPASQVLPNSDMHSICLDLLHTRTGRVPAHNST